MTSPSVVVCVVSAGRPGNVARVMSQFHSCRWYVPSDQAAAYIAAGAPRAGVRGVVGKMPMKSIQLSRALSESFSEGYDVVATVDDDIIHCKSKYTRKAVPLMDVVNRLAQQLFDSDRFTLAGPYSGGNTSWSPDGEVHHGRAPGAMMLHQVCDRVAFDNDIVGMEDLDFCIQHHVYNHGLILDGGYCLENEWTTNPGGYQDYRSAEQVAATVAKLVTKWAKYGCKFWADPSHRNGMRFRVPWKRLCG